MAPLHRTGRGILPALALAASVVVLALAAPTAGAAPSAPVTITDYANPSQALAWGQKSHWKQPWRAYLETLPATTLLNAVGINFNVTGTAVPSTARLLGASGFRRARVEVPWSTIEYGDPATMREASRTELEAKLTALRANGIRPLILLNANHGKPCPVELGTVQLTQPAEAGATEIHVDPSELAEIEPGRTGINSGGVAAQYLFTAVAEDGTVELSAPLGSIEAANGSTPAIGSLPAGPLAIETLRYEPFHSPLAADGTRSPAFEATLGGWLEYVGAVTREARRILGSEDFDVEVWNELSFGSRFLSTSYYYEPDLERTSGIADEILARTVAYLRDPRNGVAGIGIGDGFANQTPWPSAASLPLGLTAIDKHPYPRVKSFPADATIGGNRPLDGLGKPAGIDLGRGLWQEAFSPSYEAYFPEYALSAIQTETLVRDLAPTPSKFGGIEHGRFVHAPGGQPAQLWITELNLDPRYGPVPTAEMSQADIRRIMSKDTLRSLVAYVNKGATALDFYAAKASSLSLVEPSFFEALRGQSPVYPGDAAGGETMTAVRRLVATMGGAEPISEPRQLSFEALTDPSSRVQFGGNGTTAYPPLYNRDVFAFLPFQVSSTRFAVPYYVMTRNVAEVYRPELASSDPHRFDMPPEPYDLRIGGVDGEAAEVTASDPLTGESVPVRVLARSDRDVTVEVLATDSPRVLAIQEGAGTEAPPTEGDEGESSPPAPVEEGGGKPPAGERAPQPTEASGAKPTGEAKSTTRGTTTARPPKADAESEAAPEPAAPPPAPRFQLRQLPTLLANRRLVVLARYRAPYTLGIKARVEAGRRSFALEPGYSTTRVAKPGRTAVVLRLGGGVARALRRARAGGAPLRLVVAVDARPESGGAASAERSFPIP